MRAHVSTPDRFSRPPMLDATPPDFTLRDVEGGTARLAELYLLGPLVLVFCRGGETCAQHLREFRKRHAALIEAGATLVVVMTDRARADALTQKEHLGYRVLVDEGGRVADQWGLTKTIAEDGAPTFIIDKAGAVRFRVVEGEAARKPAGKVLEWLRGHGYGEAQS